MNIEENADLSSLNTFGIQAQARYLTTVTEVEHIQEIISSRLFRDNRHLILGGGSNILFTGNFNGWVIRNVLSGKNIVRENNDEVVIRIGSGEVWHSIVTYCVDQQWGGIENLSLIPGTAGAAPMQNIGAYGVEIKDVIESVEAIELATGKVRTFARAECRFGYRDSIFKQEARGLYFISSITLTLTRRNHRIHTEYGALREHLPAHKEPTLREISEAVMTIRRSKLPDPREIGNAGSFFKNPVVTPVTFQHLRDIHSDIPSFPADEGKVKIPAAWLIEQCGWKGFTRGKIGVHKHQALVLVNHGGGEGRELWKLAREIQSTVQERFHISLHPEVNVIDDET